MFTYTETTDIGRVALIAQMAAAIYAGRSGGEHMEEGRIRFAIDRAYTILAEVEKREGKIANRPETEERHEDIR
jgi:hypothetical protein